MTTCSTIGTFSDIRPYFPSAKELRCDLYALFASVITASVLYGPAWGLVAGCGFLSSYCCYKLVDYLGDRLLKGRVTDQFIELIKCTIKVAGSFLAAFCSIVIFKHSLEMMIVGLVLSLLLGAYFKALDPIILAPYLL